MWKPRSPVSRKHVTRVGWLNKIKDEYITCSEIPQGWIHLRRENGNVGYSKADEMGSPTLLWFCDVFLTVVFHISNAIVEKNSFCCCSLIEMKCYSQCIRNLKSWTACGHQPLENLKQKLYRHTVRLFLCESLGSILHACQLAKQSKSRNGKIT